MRTLTVDTRGLFFSLRTLVVVGLLVAVWYAWVPLEQYRQAAAEAAALTANALSGMTQQDLAPLLAQEDQSSGQNASAASAIPAAGKFVRIDLKGLTVGLYENGVLVSLLPIVHVPAANAPGAPPVGTYTVDLTSAEQLSTIGLVRFPDYVKFGDRYAIHGIPMGAHGETLDDEYQSGSVTLSTDDAATLFAFANAGVPVSVIAGQQAPENIPAPTSLEVSASSDLPATTASAYSVVDVEHGQTFIVKNGGDRFPIASVTKLFTASVASELIDHAEQVTAPNGETYTLGDLYYPLILRSDNGVADRIASHVGLATFLAQMNAFATAHGMQDTSFADPSGLSPRNLSTSNDLVLLARVLYQTKPFLLDISSEENMTITSLSGVKWNMQNQNKLAADPYFRGGKLGYTDEAGQTSLALFNVPIHGETHVVAVVVLGSKDWKQDTRTLLRWLIANVDTVE
jgi:D-alanyl-D-alanine endopeptidase (penicillin-binding protein 7)